MNSHDISTAIPDSVPSSSLEIAQEIASADVKVEMALPPIAPQPTTYRKVAADYFRIVTAIDDEIYKKGRFDTGEEGQMLTKRFDSLRQSCEDRGMVCHLLQFPEFVGDATDYDDPETRKHLDRAVASAKIADVVVLDWNLGHKTHHGNALHILEALTKAPRMGFVMIHTQQRDLKAVSVELQTAFKTWNEPLQPLSLDKAQTDAIPEVPASEQDEDNFEAGEVAESKQYGFHLNHRLFVFLSVKNEQDAEVGVRAEQLVDVIYDALEASLEGRLKWAGLELMARVREVFPQVIAALPNADPALLGQILFQREDEVAAQVADSLLDELRHILVEKPLEIVSDQELFAALKKHMVSLCSDPGRWEKVVEPSTCADTNAGREKSAEGKTAKSSEQSAWERFQVLAQNWEKAELDSLRIEIVEEDKDNKEADPPLFNVVMRSKSQELVRALAHLLVESADDEEVLKTHIAWSQVRESVLLSKNVTLRPGAVLRKVNGPDIAPEWLFCQTGACDCYRPTGFGFTFIVGSLRKKPRSRQSETQACVGGHEIVWDAAHMHILQDPTAERQLEAGKGHTDCQVELATYEIAGALRSEFAARTIQRVFNHQGRIGVNTCELIRVRRGE